MSTPGPPPPPVSAPVIPAAPASASARAYLRDGLPTVYLDGDFGMRFVGALELVLDPIVGTLDSLAAHLAADLGPQHLLALLGSWLGLITDEDLPVGVRRALVRNAAELMRCRGTVSGIERILALTFPDLALSVSDSGGVWILEDGADLPPVAEPELVVSCAVALHPDQREAILRVLERERPVHVVCVIEEPGRRTVGTKR